MYRKPHKIWVRALVRQFGPAADIFTPGTACGMPYAPEYAFCACTFQLLSRDHKRFSGGNWRGRQPNLCRSERAICRGVGAAVAMVLAAVIAVAALAVPVLAVPVLAVPVLAVAVLAVVVGAVAAVAAVAAFAWTVAAAVSNALAWTCSAVLVRGRTCAMCGPA
jgi:hypothetical protein